MSRFYKIGFLVLTVALLAGCPKKPVDIEVGEEGGTTTQDTTTKQDTTGGTGIKQDDIKGVIDPRKDPANILSERSVYFAFDSYVVEDDFRPLVEAHARYLLGNPGAKMEIQGHTDERGTHEYNIALGQRRADAVKRMMVLLGAKEAQIETYSFGKEEPRNLGHNEEAWAENRRSDIVYADER